MSRSGDRSRCWQTGQDSKHETIEQFIDKFNTLRIKSGVQDSHVLVNYFLEALPNELVERFNITLESVSTEKKRPAHVQYETSSGSKRSSSLPNTQVNRDQGSSSDHKLVRFPRPTSGFAVSEKKPKTGMFCAFHRVTTHNTEECQARKRGDVPKNKNNCRRCGSPGWTPAHRCGSAVCSGPSDKDITVR
ncbi:hypothetical protein A0J61_02133, partial [Choanephora cucurbitarum]